MVVFKLNIENEEETVGYQGREKGIDDRGGESRGKEGGGRRTKGAAECKCGGGGSIKWGTTVERTNRSERAGTSSSGGNDREGSVPLTQGGWQPEQRFQPEQTGISTEDFMERFEDITVDMELERNAMIMEACEGQRWERKKMEERLVQQIESRYYKVKEWEKVSRKYIIWLGKEVATMKGKMNKMQETMTKLELYTQKMEG